MAKKQTLEQVEASMARWQTRLRRAVTMIDKLGRQRKRLAKAQASPPVARPEPLAVTIMKEMTAPAPTPAPPVEIENEIPAFLRRQKPGNPIGDQIKAEIEAKKTAKARGRIATMKAKKAGDLKKMPLTGKAALAAIRG
jgi:hypothetical protein